MTMRLVTPRHEVTGERMHLMFDIPDVLYQSILEKSADWSFTKHDKLSGAIFHVRAAPCGIQSCFCDAVAVEARTEAPA